MTGMFPFAIEGGLIHLAEPAAKHLDGQWETAKEKYHKGDKVLHRPNILEASRIVILENGWVRALVSDYQENHDVLLPPHAVLFVETTYSRGEHARGRFPNYTRSQEQRRQLHNNSWDALAGEWPAGDTKP